MGDDEDGGSCPLKEHIITYSTCQQYKMTSLLFGAQLSTVPSTIMYMQK